MRLSWSIFRYAWKPLDGLLRPFGLCVLMVRDTEEEERDGWRTIVKVGPARIYVGRCEARE